MNLNEKIRLLRNERKMSQQNLADKIGATKTAIWKYENEQAMPSAEIIKRIAIAFSVSTDYLLFDESEKESVTKISDKKLLRQFEEIDRLDETEKVHIRYVLDLAINNQKIKQMAV
jgi:transcriptional regulator with XRE-family HTH domain